MLLSPLTLHRRNTVQSAALLLAVDALLNRKHLTEGFVNSRHGGLWPSVVERLRRRVGTRNPEHFPLVSRGCYRSPKEALTLLGYRKDAVEQVVECGQCVEGRLAGNQFSRNSFQLRFFKLLIPSFFGILFEESPRYSAKVAQTTALIPSRLDPFSA